MSILEPACFMRKLSIQRYRAHLIAVFTIILFGGPAIAADFSGDLSVDSTIELIAEGGDETMSIRISTVLSDTQVSTSGSGRFAEAAMPYRECSDLWQYLLERDVATLSDAPVVDPMPDQALFTFTFRSGTETNTFSAYGVDFLEDKRYREIAMAIMNAAKKYE